MPPAATPQRAETAGAGGRGRPAIDFRGVGKRYGTTAVLDGLDLPVAEGDFVVVYGPPASGKSVLMRLLMGLEHPTNGRVWLRGEDVTTVPAADRNIGYVPQSFALYPHLSVAENIAYPLKLAKEPRGSIGPVVRHAAEMLAITPLLGKRPEQLSGGQKQRVAIARGIAKRTGIYVFDDPLAGLDFKLREQLVDDLRALQRETGATFVYTTSDPLEALTLADTVAVLDGGRVVEHGDPEALYREPAHARTMTLLGFPRANLLGGALSRRGEAMTCEVGPFAFPVEPARDGVEPGPVLVGIRPEDVTLGRPGAPVDGPAGTLRADARVLLREDLGGEEIVYLDCGGTALTTVVRHAGTEPADARVAPDIDAPATVAIRPADLLLFAPGDGRRLGRGASGGGRG
jgi:ABC-type sugar transport system ATPase subunit